MSSLQVLHQRLGLYLAERDRVRNALENQSAVVRGRTLGKIDEASSQRPVTP